MQSQRIGGDEHHRKHHEPENETSGDARWVDARSRSLDGLHHTTALEDLIEADAAHQSIGPLLEQSRQQITGKENDQRAEERGHITIELLEASLQSFAESECRRGIH